MIYPWLDVADIEAAARSLRSKALGSDGDATPLLDLDAIVFDYLCEHEEMCFDDEHDLGWEDGEQVLGRMKPIPGRIEITSVLKDAPDLGRYRFTVAHELGHWVLHRPLFLAQAETLDLFGSTLRPTEMMSLHRAVFPSAAKAYLAPEEWQANRFAADLLVGVTVLRREFEERFDATVIARNTRGWRLHARTLREHSRRLACGEINGRAPLCSVFDLSCEAMAITLEERGYAVEEPPLI
jgi:hypothetical protein